MISKIETPFKSFQAMNIRQKIAFGIQKPHPFYTQLLSNLQTDFEIMTYLTFQSMAGLNPAEFGAFLVEDALIFERCCELIPWFKTCSPGNQLPFFVIASPEAPCQPGDFCPSITRNFAGQFSPRHSPQAIGDAIRKRLVQHLASAHGLLAVPGIPGQNHRPVLRRGDLELDPNRHLVLKQGKPVTLTVREFALLELLMSHPDQPFSRKQLLKLIWTDSTVTERTIDAHIKTLRKKLGCGSECIETLIGRGYVFREIPVKS
jgi:DNA-binding CsgD family transcriptional regulator